MRIPALSAALVGAALLALGCEISPVVTAPAEPSGRYYDCERAAERYCERVEGESGDALDRCVAERTYDCLSGAAP